MFQSFPVAYLRRNVKVKEAKRLSFLRESVAFVLSQSAKRVPHAAAIAHFDVSTLVEYTDDGSEGDDDQSQGTSKKQKLRRAIRRNYTAFFLKAIAHSLHHVPKLNSFLDYAPYRMGGRLYIAEDINLSFTVHTKYGVIKPIVRDPQRKDLETVAGEMRVLARRARRTDPEELYRAAARAYIGVAIKELDLLALPALLIYVRSMFHSHKPDPAFKGVPNDKKLKVTDILGATCTVANIGMMMSGHQTLTVLVPPEVMMFGIGDIRQVPWVVDGKVVPRHAVTIAGTIDHRALDGGEVFPFYGHLRRYIDNPALIYNWKPGDEI